MLESLVKKATLEDAFIVFVGALAIIGIWRGSWNLMDEYLLSEHFLLSQIVSILFGVAILFALSKIK